MTKLVRKCLPKVSFDIMLGTYSKSAPDNLKEIGIQYMGDLHLKEFSKTNTNLSCQTFTFTLIICLAEGKNVSFKIKQA